MKARFKNVVNGFVMRNALRFMGNMVENFDKEVMNEEFFDLIHYSLGRNEVRKIVKESLGADDVKTLCNTDRYDHIDFVSDSTDHMLKKIWNADGFRAKAKSLILSIKDRMLTGITVTRSGACDEIEERFNALVRFLSLSEVESDVLLYAYIRHATVLSEFPTSARYDGEGVFFAMALDRPLEQVLKVMGRECKLRRYNCISEDWKFNVEELGEYLSGNEKRSLEEHFYHRVDGETLPWEFFGKLSENEGAMLCSLLKSHDGGRMNILLYGAAGTGKSCFARSLVKQAGLKAYEVAQEDEDDRRRSSVENRLARVRICNDNLAGTVGVIIVDEADALLRTSGVGFSIFSDSRMSSEKGVVNTLLDDLKTPVIWICNMMAGEMAESVRRRFDYSVLFKMLSRTQREMIWRNNIGKLHLEKLVDESRVKYFSARYETSAGGITMTLENLKKLDPPVKRVSEVVEKLMKPHCELMQKHIDLGKNEPAVDYSLEGLNVKGDIPLAAIIKAAKNYLAGKSGGVDSPRMNILLWGPPGSGKSEFVKYFCRQIDRQCSVKMASDLLSPFVGVAEMKIANAFEEAEVDGTVLFLDEVDGMVADRSEADHNWEVTQVNELLYQMENFKGIFIGATNRNDNLDPAVMRRFTFKIEFDDLDNAGKVIFFERMFGTKLSDVERGRLCDIESLAPGDFRTARQRLFYLGNEVTNEMRINAVEQECATKRRFKRTKIGF